MGNVLILSQYGGMCKGNFIPSLLELQSLIEKKTKSKVVYALCEKCLKFDWIQEIKDTGSTVDFFHNDSLLNEIKYLNGIIKKHNISVIYTHFEPFVRSLFFIKLLHPGILIVNHMHSDFSANEKKKLNFASKFKIAINDFMFKYIFVSSHFTTKKGVTIANALVTSRLPEINNNIPNDYIREHLGLKKEDIIIIMFGWHKHIKGVDIACSSLNYLNEPLKSRCKLCIIGSYTEADYEYIEKYCDNPQNVYFLQSRDDIFTYHLSADIMLSSSRSEGFSYALLESLSVGTPAIVSDIPGTLWASEYDNVQVFESQNPQSLAKAIEKCISENDMNLNKRVAEKVIADHNIDKWCEAVFRVLNSTGKLVEK